MRGVEIQGFEIAAIHVCACGNIIEDIPPPSWSTVGTRSFSQTTAAKSGKLNLTAPMPPSLNRFAALADEDLQEPVADGGLTADADGGVVPALCEL